MNSINPLSRVTVERKKSYHQCIRNPKGHRCKKPTTRSVTKRPDENENSSVKKNDTLRSIVTSCPKDIHCVGLTEITPVTKSTSVSKEQLVNEVITDWPTNSEEEINDPSRRRVPVKSIATEPKKTENGNCKTIAKRKRKSNVTVAVTPSPAFSRIKKKKSRRNCKDIDADTMSKNFQTTPDSKSISDDSSLSNSSPSSHFSDSSSDSTSELPQGVIDIDASCCADRATLHQMNNENTNTLNPTCICLHHAYDHNHTSVHYKSFLSSYSREYYQYIHQAELEPFPASSFEFDTLSNRHSTSSRSSDSCRRSARLKTVGNCKRNSLPGSFFDMSQMESSEFRDYLKRNPLMTAEMRAMVADWLSEVTEDYMLSCSTLHLAVNLFDRSLACGKFVADIKDHSYEKKDIVIERTTLQCLGCACMMIACKIDESEPHAAKTFAYLSEDSYTEKEINVMESKVCAALRFKLHAPTAYTFVDRFLSASSASDDIVSQAPWLACTSGMSNNNMTFMVQYLLEISLLVYELVPKTPSLVAASAVYLARATLEITDEQKSPNMAYWSKTLQFYTGYSILDLNESVILLHKAHQEIEKHKYNHIFQKYSHKKYRSIALKVAVLKDSLGFKC